MSVALITGGSRGIGSIIAETLAQAGHDIAICFSGNEEAAKQTVENCLKYGNKAICFKANVSNAEEVNSLIDKVKNALGPVEVLVNNAGITKDGLLLRMSEEDFDSVIDINLKGTYLCTKAVLKDMMKARNGRIINITSIVGLRGNAGQANYAASKAGIIGFTKSVAMEYGPKGIRTNAVAPGFIETAMTETLPEETKKAYLEKIPARHFGKPQDVANVVEFLASEKAEYINGQVISVDGGM